MIDIDIRSDIKSVTRGLRAYRKQIPFATSKALNTTANDVRGALEKKTRQVFKAPTRYTQRPIYVKYSNKTNLTASVEIKSATGDNASIVPGIKGGGAQWSYFKHNIEGGPRPLKGYERSMLRAGLLPQGMYTVPAKGIPLNRNGNLTRGRIQKMLANIQANALAGTNTPRQWAPRSKRGSGLVQRKYFVANIKGVMGVWERMAGRKIRLFLLYIKRPTYRARYPYTQTVQRVVANKFTFHFRKAMRAAIASARP